MLKQRVITALILAPIVLSGLFLLEPFSFSIFVGLIVALGAWEWANLAGIESQLGRVLYALGIVVILVVSSATDVIWWLLLSVLWWLWALVMIFRYPELSASRESQALRVLLGIVLLVPFWKALVFIRGVEVQPWPELSPLWLILYMLLVVWAADIGAYFAGKTWGKSKLAPRVSPGKSWAGAWGGLASAALLAIIAALLLEMTASQALVLVIATLLTAIVSIVGDLTESMFKRQRGIKDSSQLLPGHGGILDRIDSLLAAIPVFVCALFSLGWVVLS